MAVERFTNSQVSLMLMMTVHPVAGGTQKKKERRPTEGFGSRFAKITFKFCHFH
jgi:hypothetical protein